KIFVASSSFGLHPLLGKHGNTLEPTDKAHGMATTKTMQKLRRPYNPKKERGSPKAERKDPTEHSFDIGYLRLLYKTRKRP
ncbi:hypothetical protein HAX54_051135, partial [Datura stramonium]|nr:hypothetical protein [Datura stramonium]